MHTFLTLANTGEHWFVEREIFGMTSALRAYCDSIDSCDINVEGPSGEGEARCWRVALKVRIFDETVRAKAQAAEGSDPHQSLSRVLADVYASARMQLDHIAERHGGCCARGGQDIAARLEACA